MAALPLFGANHIKLVVAPAGDVGRTSVLWPVLNELGLQVIFRGGMCDVGDILLEPTDDIKDCPGEQWLLYCRLCNKFLFPPDAHRASRAHQNQTWWRTWYSYESLRLYLDGGRRLLGSAPTRHP